MGNVGHQQRELRFPLGILHCHSLPPACWERGAKALIPVGSLYRECREQVGDSTQCLHISLDVASWRSAYAPFPPRKHCWPLVQVLESLLSIDHWHRPAKIGAIWADRVAHICQRHWPPMETSVIPRSRPSRHWKLATRSWYEHRKR